MTITATELKNNLGKYLITAAEEDIHITKNGKEIARLTRAVSDRLQAFESMIGIISEKDIPADPKKARLSKQW